MTILIRMCTGLVLAVWLMLMPTHAEPNVAASIKPVHALVAAVMDGTGSPKLILSGNSSPHHTSLKPSQRRIIEAANIIFHIGGGLEQSLEKPLARKKADGVQVIALIEAPGVALLRVRESGVWHSEPHDDRTAQDPHIWLDPINAKAMTSTIAKTLASADPANAGRYRANAGRFAESLAKLHRDIETLLVPVRKKPFIVFHDSYQYFEKRFGLNAAGAITIDPDKRPGARRLRDIRQVLSKRGATCVFAEPHFDAGYVETVIEGSGARSAMLDPVGSNLTGSGDAYIKLLGNLAETIAQCLGRAP